MTVGESEADAMSRLTVLEELKSACAAAQVRETARVIELRASDEDLRNVPMKRRGRGLSAEIGLARKASPRKGAQFLGFARALTDEMPHTMRALTSGELTEWRATILVRETAYLTRETREEMDRRICADSSTLDGVSDRALDALAKKHAYELDPHAVVARSARAEKDRRVGVRPAPDLMTTLSALLPMKQGVAVYASLKQHADSIVGADDRTHPQIMADTLVERVTGQSSAEKVPVAVNVVMSERTLLTDSDEAAEVPGFGPIPGHLARQMIADGTADDNETLSTIRRLFARPADGTLVSMDARSRTFPKSLAHFVAMRDRCCRTPYCGAPIAEIDHAHPHRDGGATTGANGDGACRTHNRAKEADGWRYAVIDAPGGHRIEIQTPTGAVHESVAPPAIGHVPDTVSVVETRLRAMLNAA
ncbi:HNH endonuclease signature motif containing protein [Gordonia sp. PKS22-38]|uniref:HNH endonuclease signature motif containing protein n=1 Tax=Gordonia prachuapensis TaxID=3115651 RepID=A0ABU7MXN9_9ACTN|nr:HNH endonuclease signature motif containing protein [Gordonia sp. PKS22-38]